RDTVRSLVNKVAGKGIEVSHMTILRHLSNPGCKKNLPQVTPMLTMVHKEKRVEWARKHLNMTQQKKEMICNHLFRLLKVMLDENLAQAEVEGVHKAKLYTIGI
ncbi:3742_t:CDS:1, partial [Entrophospora sp. SA101]